MRTLVMAVSPQQDLAFRQKDRDYCVLRNVAVCYEFVVVVLLAICISRFPESHLLKKLVAMFHRGQTGFS